jgi:acetylornithine deacetylase
MTFKHLQTLPFLEKIISFDSTSCKSNLEVIHFIEGYFQSLGLITKLTYNTDKTKANLFATIPAVNGNAKTGGIIFSGHTDVVPIEGQLWDYEPFALSYQDKKFYGRGTCDMKTFVAGTMAFAEQIQKRGPSVPIHFAFSYDEEIGCLGVPVLLEDIVARGITPKICIVGEPTMMKPVIGHKGRVGYQCTIYGKECHSSMTHLGVNAVEIAAELITFLNALGRRLRDHGPHHFDYAPHYTTVHTGVIHGGTVVNIVPNHCYFEFELRYLPGDEPQKYLEELKTYIKTSIVPEMQKISPKSNVTIELKPSIIGLATPEDSEVVKFITSLTGSNHVEKVSYGTEAGIFSQFGIETIIFGPGSIEQAHQQNEFIELSQIELFEKFMIRLMDKVCVN